MPDQGNDNIFGGNTNDTNNGANGITPNANSDDLTTLLGAIKNERGEPKYKTINDALNALKHSQEYIPTLKNKEQELEQQLRTANEQLAELAEIKRTVQTLTQNQASAATTPNGLNEEQVAALVSRTLSKTQQEALAKQNTDSVIAAVKAAHGDKAAEVFYGKARELGMSPEQINDLAARTPVAALTLLGVGKQASPVKPPSGTVNTDGFQPQENSFVGRSTKSIMVGATTQDIREASNEAKKMVEELHAQNISVHDLTDPKIYFKQFGKR